jgi:sporulation protein YunB
LAFILLLVAVLLLGLGLWLLEASLLPTFKVLARNQAEWTANRAIQEAVLEQAQALGLSYNDLVRLEKDAQQRVVYLGTNVLVVNRLVASVSLAVQRRFEGLKEERFDIPLGQVLGSELLANYGPRLDWQIVPTGVVRVSIREGFQSAGINQTRHYLSVRVESSVRVVIPFSSEEIRVATEVPLVDSIIVGTVPQTLVGLSLGERTFDIQRSD